MRRGRAIPVKIAENAIRHARDYGNDLVFLDTAGRLHVDEALMDELKRMKASVHPNEILLVVDAMTGQDAVNAAGAFDEALGIDGVVLTKLDGDARGGAALSIKAATGKPIKFVGTGEKLDMIEPFHPDRMASRILGMGDMLSFIEKAQQTYDEKQAKKLEEKLKKNSFTLSGLFRPASADQGHGRSQPAGRHDARESGQQAAGGTDRRKGHGSYGGHHPLHDPGGTGKSPDAGSQPETAHCRRLRSGRGGCKPAPQAI